MCGETCVSVQGLRKRIEELGERVDGQTRFEVEFERLLATSLEVEFTCDVAARQENVARNRYQTNLPSECACLSVCLCQTVRLCLSAHLRQKCLCASLCLSTSMLAGSGDTARVVLIGKEEDENDYINASYIDVSSVWHTIVNPPPSPMNLITGSAGLLQPEGLPGHPGSS